MICSSFLMGIFSFAQIEGTWQGNLKVQGIEIPLVFHVKKEAFGFSSQFDSPKQGAKEISIESTIFTNNEVTFDASNLGIVYKGKFNSASIDGTFVQNGMNLPLKLEKIENYTDQTILKRPQTPNAPYDYPTEEVSFVNPIDDNRLAGTLSLPKNKKDFPIAILITGSGAQNRDSEMLEHKPFLVIADDFAKKGIGTLRLDDRGVGGSTAGSSHDTSENFAGDINAAVEYLLKRGYKNIGLVGHSEGGMIAQMVAAKNKNIKFVVSMAGPSIPITDLMVLQNKKINELYGLSDQQIKDDIAIKKHYFEFMKNYNGKHFEDDAHKNMTDFFSRNTFEMPKDQQNQLTAALIQQTNNAWYKFFMKYDPEIYLRQIKIPFLALNGSLDSQVLPKENLNKYRQIFMKNGNKNVKIEEFPQLNHLFQTAKTGSPQEYENLEESISPIALKSMSNWILGLQ